MNELKTDYLGAVKECKFVLFYPYNDRERLRNLFEYDYKLKKISNNERNKCIFDVNEICDFALDLENCR